MKATVAGVPVEGTPEEIAKLMELTKIKVSGGLNKLGQGGVIGMAGGPVKS